jgi:hypothetical protein
MDPCFRRRRRLEGTGHYLKKARDTPDFPSFLSSGISLPHVRDPRHSLV